MIESADSREERIPQVRFKEKLQTILYTPVYVENVSHFADDALEQLITLNEMVVSEYQRDYEESDQYTGKELEDRAYAAYGLENINEILDRISAVRNTIAKVTSELKGNLEQVDTIITPPDTQGSAIINPGNGTFESPRMLDRLITLAYILEHDFGIDGQSANYVKGITTDAMFRQEPYVRVEVAELNRVVYICDEEGNASYVFDT